MLNVFSFNQRINKNQFIFRDIYLLVQKMNELSDNVASEANDTNASAEVDEQQTTLVSDASEIVCVNTSQQSSNFEEILCESALECVPIEVITSSESTDSNTMQAILDENAELKKSNEQYGSLLRQRDDAIELQKKELTLLEAEKEALRREYETGRKEKEQAVVRYVMLEKSIIDANAAKDLSTRKLRDSQKEAENLTTRLKQVTGERDKAHKEIRDFLRESEQLKYNLQTLETKLKWSQRSVTVERSNRVDLEKRLNEVTDQLNQLNEQHQQQIDTERRCEREQDAQLIMMKHLVDEKERALVQLQKSHDELKTAFALLFEKKEQLSKDCEIEQHKYAELEKQLSELEIDKTERTTAFEELQVKFNANERRITACINDNESLTAAISKLHYIEESYTEQSEEMSAIRSKEDEYLSLLRDMTEKCVLAENKLILANSKSSALQLDNERLNKEFKVKAKEMVDTEEDLVKMRHKHSEEIKLFNRIIAEEKSRGATLQSKLDDIVGDLEATRNKHSQTVKELNREVVMLRKSSNQSSPSADSGFGTDTDNRNDTTRDDINGSSSACGQEPSKKTLIDRIVKLQRQLAKQTEKIEFLENHCVALFNELKSKSA